MRLRTIGLISTLALGLLVLPLPANAQKPGRPYRIGALNQAFAPNPPSVEGLKAGLKAMGLEEGRDVTFDIRFTKGNPHETQAAAAALVEAGVDLIFTSGEVSARAAKPGQLPTPRDTTHSTSPRPENAATARLVRPVSSTASYARGSRKSIRTSLRNVERESSNSIQRESTNSIVSAWGSGPMTPGEQKSNKRRSTSGRRFRLMWR